MTRQNSKKVAALRHRLKRMQMEHDKLGRRIASMQRSLKDAETHKSDKE